MESLESYNESQLRKGDLVKIRSWRTNISRVGVVMREVRDSYLSDFSRYEVLIEDELVCVRRDMLQKIDKKKL